jgi:hypothetical protein
MVGPSRHDAHIDPVTLIPAGKAIDDINAISSIEIVDGTFTVDPPDLPGGAVSVSIQ